MRITDQQIQVLSALARYQYLTAQQMADIGLSASAKALRNKSLPRLKNRGIPFIASESFGVIPTKGRLADIYYLKKAGVFLLAEALNIHPETITYPKGGVQFSRDYFHRVAFIDFHISFRRWAKQNGKAIEFFHSYFDTVGHHHNGKVYSASKNNFYLQRSIYTHDKNTVFIPDGLARYQEGEKRRLVAIEIHNGTHSQRITKQLLDHIEAMQAELFHKKFQHDKASFVFSVHENQATLDSVKNRLMAREEFREVFLRLFHFNLQSQAKADFATGWTLADGSPSALF